MQLPPHPKHAFTAHPAAAAAAHAGLTAEQETLAHCLPLFKQLLDALASHGDARRLEPLCSTLLHLARLLPPALAGAVGDWAEEVAKGDSLNGSHHVVRE